MVYWNKTVIPANVFSTVRTMRPLPAQPPQSIHSPRPLWRFVGVAVILAVLFGVLWYVTLLKNPLRMVRETSERKLHELRLALNARSSNLDALERSTQYFDALGRDVPQRLDQALPTDPRIPELWYGIRGLIQRLGMVLDTIEFSGLDSSTSSMGVRTGGTPLRVQPTTITLQLSRVGYEQLKKFITVLGQHIRVIEIVTLQYSAAESRASMSFMVYSVSL